MIRAPCPFCGRENLVGFFPEERPVRCEHFVYQGFARNVGAEYVLKEFGRTRTLCERCKKIRAGELTR